MDTGERRKRCLSVADRHLTYTANTGIPVTEAVAIIAITRFEQKPLPIDYRELNIHVWGRREEQENGKR